MAIGTKLCLARLINGLESMALDSPNENQVDDRRDRLAPRKAFVPPDLGDDNERLKLARTQLEILSRRRTIRDFDSRLVPKEIIETAIDAANTAPCGANQQAWHFAIVQSPEIKKQIRIAAEEEERSFYEHRAPEEWLDALAPIGTDAHKPFLETAPYLIAVFYQAFGKSESGEKIKHYYPVESVGLATGFLISTLTAAGISTLTHTPSPMNFLRKILQRPDNERAFVLLVVGYPSEDATVPDLSKKSLQQITSWH